ncbi:MAG: DUF1295 domain-containing protein [Melioribacteraceae bacterium]|nr:DUF1295 domain-containing protein [Melioribacteraceae bacterium]
MSEIISISALTILIYVTLFYIVAQIKTDNSIIDIGWGIGFILVTSVLFFLADSITNIQLLFILMILVWGVRLSFHILKRSIGKPEDFRYQEFRRNWGDKYLIKAYYKVFLLQGGFMLFISAPIYVVFNSTVTEFNILNLLGIVIFIIGFLTESIADLQLNKFKKDESNKGKIITTGLWKYSRHPNYFGEALLWWGIFIYVVSFDYGIAAAISPIFLNYLLVYISGVPMLEKKYEGREDWETYKSKTSKFIPWFSRLKGTK